MNTQIITNPTILDEVYRLRREVWLNMDPRLEPFLPKDKWKDTIDNEAIHFGVFQDNELCAAARLSIHHSYNEIDDLKGVPQHILEKIPLKTAMLGRLVVKPKYQGKKISSILDASRIEEALKHNCLSIIAMTDDRRLNKLISIGFNMQYKYNTYPDNRVKKFLEIKNRTAHLFIKLL